MASQANAAAAAASFAGAIVYGAGVSEGLGSQSSTGWLIYRWA